MSSDMLAVSTELTKMLALFQWIWSHSVAFSGHSTLGGRNVDSRYWWRETVYSNHKIVLVHMA